MLLGSGVPLCHGSSSVGHGYAISGASLWQSFLKAGKGREVLQRFAYLNMSGEGRGQGHRLEQGLKKCLW